MPDLDAEAPLVRAAARAGVRDQRVLRAVREVPRGAFVPLDQVGVAERDVPLPIPHGLVTTQPSLVARMVEALSLTGTERVLEVGAGLGYQTALLARLAAFVWGVELWPDLAAAAQGNLTTQGVRNAEVVVADGSLGLAAHAPFDAIVVAAAYPTVPPPLVAQLAVGGRCVQPIGPGGHEDVVLFARTPDGLRALGSVTAAHFVRLHGRHGYPAPEPAS